MLRKMLYLCKKYPKLFYICGPFFFDQLIPPYLKGFVLYCSVLVRGSLVLQSVLAPLVPVLVVHRV